MFARLRCLVGGEPHATVGDDLGTGLCAAQRARRDGLCSWERTGADAHRQGCLAPGYGTDWEKTVDWKMEQPGRTGWKSAKPGPRSTISSGRNYSSCRCAGWAARQMAACRSNGELPDRRSSRAGIFLLLSPSILGGVRSRT